MTPMSTTATTTTTCAISSESLLLDKVLARVVERRTRSVRLEADGEGGKMFANRVESRRSTVLIVNEFNWLFRRLWRLPFEAKTNAIICIIYIKPRNIRWLCRAALLIFFTNFPKLHAAAAVQL